MPTLTHQKVTPFLWFESDAAVAAEFYLSVITPSKLLHASPSSATLDLDGQRLILFNGGPMYKLTPAVSLMLGCETQEEIDRYWSKLAEGGSPSRCGWLTDRYGLSWQIVPEILRDLLQDEDRAKAGRVMQAMLKMVKMDIAELLAAANAG